MLELLKKVEQKGAEPKDTVEKYGKIIEFQYGAHVVKQKVEFLRNTDSVALEFSSVSSKREDAENDINKLANRGRLFNQYQDLIPLAGEMGKPVFFTDVDCSGPEIDFLEKELLFAILATVGLTTFTAGKIIGDGIAKHYLYRNRSVSRTSRRGFLKTILNAGISTILAADVVVTADLVRKMYAEDIVDSEHLPDATKIVKLLRNLVMAQKLEFLAKNSIAGSKMAQVIGSAHGNLPETNPLNIVFAMKMSERDRLRAIWEMRDLVTKGIGDIRTLYTIPKLDFNKKENKWKCSDIFEEPNLKNMVEKMAAEKY